MTPGLGTSKAPLENPVFTFISLETSLQELQIAADEKIGQVQLPVVQSALAKLF